MNEYNDRQCVEFLQCLSLTRIAVLSMTRAILNTQAQRQQAPIFPPNLQLMYSYYTVLWIPKQSRLTSTIEEDKPVGNKIVTCSQRHRSNGYEQRWEPYKGSGLYTGLIGRYPPALLVFSLKQWPLGRHSIVGCFKHLLILAIDEFIDSPVTEPMLQSCIWVGDEAVCLSLCLPVCIPLCLLVWLSVCLSAAMIRCNADRRVQLELSKALLVVA